MGKRDAENPRTRGSTCSRQGQLLPDFENTEVGDLDNNLQVLRGSRWDIVPDMPEPLVRWTGVGQRRVAIFNLHSGAHNAPNLGGAHVLLGIALADALSSHGVAPRDRVRQLLCLLLCGGCEDSREECGCDAEAGVGNVGRAVAVHGGHFDLAAEYCVRGIEGGPLVKPEGLTAGAGEIGIIERVAPIDVVCEGSESLVEGKILSVSEFDIETVGKTRRLSDDNLARRAAVRKGAPIRATTPGARWTKMGPRSSLESLGASLTSESGGWLLPLELEGHDITLFIEFLLAQGHLADFRSDDGFQQYSIASVYHTLLHTVVRFLGENYH